GNTPVIFNATGSAGSGAITGYSWSGPNGFTDNVEDPVINPGDADYPLPGNNTYYVTVTDANGCTDVDSVTINIQAPPSVTASAPSDVCGNLTINLDATGVAGAGTITGYSWSGPFGFTSSLEDPVLNPGDAAYPPAGSHTYTVTITDSNGCTDESSVNVTIQDPPAVSVSAIGDVCGNLPIIFNATGSAGSAAITGYSWSGPNGFTDNVEDPVINPADADYPAPGSHVYTVTITDANGCTDEASVSVTVESPPSITASAASAVCANQDIVFSATATPGDGTIVAYSWSGPFGYTSSAEDPVLSPGDAGYPSPGVHVYTVTVTDDNGCTDEDSVTITIQDPPTVSASAAAETCGNVAISLSATGVQGGAAITGYSWSGPNGFSTTVEDPVINPGDASYPATGTHQYYVTVTDANGCTDSASVTVVINAPPTVTAASSTTICGNDNIVLDATGVNGTGTIVSYAWSGPAGFTSSSEDPTILTTDPEYPGAGTFTYYVTVTDDNGCTGTDDIQITINAIPNVTASTSSQICGDQNIALNATGVAGGAAITGYTWSGPNGFASNLEDPTILTTDPEYPGAGTHTYFVTVTDGNGCTNTSSVNVTINATPTVTASAATAVCGNQPISLDATGVPGSGTITGYNWSGPAGFTSTQEDPTINPGTGSYPGDGVHTYFVTVTDDNGCTGTDEVTVTVNAIPLASASAQNTVCSDQTIIFNGTGIAGGAAVTGYAWSGPNGFSSSLEDPSLPPGDPAYPSAGVN
ncbi:MAG: PKD domain-containing protein, partial [Saprospiraceae bacterium]|nr:PKD domain-containing protein [Saprospiraceae bacterium]